ncbi:MAG: hypothetical protein ACK44O_06310, partial [Novosphingobium sp.]
PWIIPLVFGPEYKLDWVIVGIIGLTQAARFARVWSSSLALAYGVTGQILAATSLRLAVLPLCLLGFWYIGGMLGLAIGALAGEGLTLAYASLSLKRTLARRKVLTE